MLLISGLFSLTYAQTPEQKSSLNELAEQLKIKEQTEKTQAIRLANEKGWPLRTKDENGRITALMRLDQFGMPMYNTTHNANGAAVINSDKVYPGGSAGLNLTGAGQTLGEWDGGDVRTTHNELTGRVTDKDGVSPDGINNHPTHVAGTMIASGADANAKGMSYGASLDAYDWYNDESEMATAAGVGLKVSQHSYGLITGWAYGTWSGSEAWHWFGNPDISQTEDYYWGFYSSEAQNWDNIAANAPNYLIVKSAGNDRGQGPASGSNHFYWNGSAWTASNTARELDGGATGHQSIAHSATAKNVMTVGAVNNASAMSSFSGWGPTDDGRIKPDIVAKGVAVFSSLAKDGDGNASNNNYASWDGTSMAGPMVSGSVGLLLQHQENLHAGVALRSATMKGLILHTAGDLGNAGPDYVYGWGLMNTEAAAAVMTSHAANGNHIVESSIDQGESITYTIEAVGGEPLKATIVWTDLAGTPPAATLNPADIMLVNDLDLRITDAGSTITQPWVLDPANPSAAASTGDNIRDNVEQVYIASPTAGGVYTITVSHKGTLSGGSQDYALVVTGNSSLSSGVSSQILTFEFSSLGGDEATANSNSNAANLGSSTISRGAGLTASGNGGRFNATSWALTSIDNAVAGNDYMEFTITPNSGYQFSLSSIFLQMQRSSTGPSGIALRSSVDNYAANLDQEYAITDNTSTQNFTFTFAQANSVTAVTYRIYMWAESTGGSGGIGDGSGNDIIVHGTVSSTGAVPDPEPTNHANNFAAVAGNSSQINLSWGDNDGAQAAAGFLIVGKTGAGTFYQPVDNTDPNDDLDWNDNNFNVKVPHGTQAYAVTGLSASTQYDFKIFAYTNNGNNIDFKTDGTVPAANATTSAPPAAPVAWINEFHYDNDGGDVNESIEVVLKNAGNYTLSDISVSLYNGGDFKVYTTKTLDEFTPGIVYGDYTYYSIVLPANGIQNGSPDGLALSYQGTLITGQFLSYEGIFTATDGPANGIESTDIGVSEPGDTPIGYSLQLAGHGTAYSDFSWQEPAQSTLGAINNGQTVLLTAWTGITDATWNTGTNWDNGVPSAAYKAVIADVTTNPSVSGAIGVTNLEISSGGVLSVAHDGQLTINGTLTNSGGAAGLILESNATGTGSLLHNTADVDITIQRYLTGDANTLNAKYHTVSVPLTASSNPVAGLFSGSYLYRFDAATQLYVSMGASTTTPLDVDQGYLVYYPGTNITYDFAGKANNGAFSASVAYPSLGNNVSLVPNPYPSAIDWDAATGWTKTNLNDAIYVYNSSSSSQGNFVWASYVNGADVNGGSRYIPVGQAFFVEANAGAPVLSMNNDVRVHNSQAFYKVPSEATELLRIRTSINGLSDEIVVRFIPEASYGFDGAFDALKLMGGPAVPNIYSLASDQTIMSINSIPYNVENYDLPVGFESETEGEVTISFEGLDSFGDWVNIYFEDNLTGQITDIRTTTDYTFVHTTDNSPERFLLHFMGVTGTSEQTMNESLFSAWSGDGSVYVLNNTKEHSATIELFDLQGRLLRSKPFNGSSTLKFSGLNPNAVVLVRMTTATAVSSQKVFIR